MRFRVTLSLAGLLLAGSLPAALAQAVPAPPVPRADTVAAVQKLFKQRRTGGTIFTIIGGAFTAQILGASAAQGFSDAGGTVVGIAVLGGVPGGIGISKLVRFSKARETEALAYFRQTHKLPAYVQRRLKPKYFGR